MLRVAALAVLEPLVLSETSFFFICSIAGVNMCLTNKPALETCVASSQRYKGSCWPQSTEDWGDS